MPSFGVNKITRVNNAEDFKKSGRFVIAFIMSCFLVCMAFKSYTSFDRAKKIIFKKSSNIYYNNETKTCLK